MYLDPVLGPLFSTVQMSDVDPNVGGVRNRCENYTTIGGVAENEDEDDSKTTYQLLGPNVAN